MNLAPVKIFIKNGWKWVAKHSPTLLTVMGTGGVVTSVGLAIKATPRANKKLEEKAKELGVEKLPLKEKVKTVWKDYLPTVGMTAATLGCFWGSNLISLKQQAAIAGLYSLAEQGLAIKEKELSSLKEEMTKQLGEEKANEIQKKLEERPGTNVKLNDSGRYLFRFAGQLFYSKPCKIWKAENRINRRLNGGMEMYISLNDILDELGLALDSIYGDTLYVTADDGCEFRFDDVGFTEDAEMYIQLSMEVNPHELK